MKNYFEKSEEENFESMDSTFTPIGSADSRTQRLKKSKSEEVKRLKKSKIERSQGLKF
jgi:hypothetical protein